MTTATISPTLANTVRHLLEVRRTALDDLAAGGVRDDEWTRDRVLDVNYANRTIERYAADLGLEPGELIDACEGA